MSMQTNSPYWSDVRRNVHQILSVRSEVARRQSVLGGIIGRVGSTLSYPLFFAGYFLAHILWIFLNLPASRLVEAWDPYPYVFLATLTSAGAPFIALLVLMYQRRESRISELREKLNLQVSLHME